jgi:hypothetical protein
VVVPSSMVAREVDAEAAAKDVGALSAAQDVVAGVAAAPSGYGVQQLLGHVGQLGDLRAGPSREEVPLETTSSV